MLDLFVENSIYLMGEELSRKNEKSLSLTKILDALPASSVSSSLSNQLLLSKIKEKLELMETKIAAQDKETRDKMLLLRNLVRDCEYVMEMEKLEVNRVFDNVNRWCVHLTDYLFFFSRRSTPNNKTSQRSSSWRMRCRSVVWWSTVSLVWVFIHSLLYLSHWLLTVSMMLQTKTNRERTEHGARSVAKQTSKRTKIRCILTQHLFAQKLPINSITTNLFIYKKKSTNKSTNTSDIISYKQAPVQSISTHIRTDRFNQDPIFGKTHLILALGDNKLNTILQNVNTRVWFGTCSEGQYGHLKRVPNNMNRMSNEWDWFLWKSYSRYYLLIAFPLKNNRWRDHTVTSPVDFEVYWFH